jgi:REP element-mobilizing transposase RayT
MLKARCWTPTIFEGVWKLNCGLLYAKRAYKDRHRRRVPVTKEGGRMYARRFQVCLTDTPYYHVVSRCVRRAWLWGRDEYAGRDYAHRKAWVLARISVLTKLFAIDICAYAVMSNHYHLVIRVNRSVAQAWDDAEVVARWSALFGVPPLLARWRRGEASASECRLAQELIARWRERLYDLSWFMRCLNEHLARRANAEDSCTGRFWEGRFRSQALLDEAGLLTAMAYVDLNPIRAGISETPETSQFTSIYERIQALGATGASTPAPALLPFRARNLDERMIPYRLEDYLELVDWTGRMIRPGKSGSIDARLPRIMDRLGIDARAWQTAMQPCGNVFGRAMGTLSYLRLHASTLGQSWVRGLRQAKRLYAC